MFNIRHIRALGLALVSLAIWALLSVAAFAQERITDFDVRVVVETSGDLIVTEAITVHAEGRQIKRGIFRELPRYLGDKSGQKIPVKYDVLSVSRNGQKEPYKISKENNAFRIRIGDGNVFLPAGQHAYILTYRAPNQVRYQSAFDEVYWNVTGNYWDFPIERASAVIEFPAAAPLLEINGYTGALGKAGRDYSGQISENIARFKSTRGFTAGEGMTVSVTARKGVIDPPSQADKNALWWLRHGMSVLFGGLAALVTGFYMWAWNKAGRDPVKPPLIPRYSPPDGYSAAACSYIYYRTISQSRALVATLFGLAHKGRIEIESEKKVTKITGLAPDNAQPLNGEERLLAELLTPNIGKSLTLDGKPNSSFHKKNYKFQRALISAYGQDYYKPNGAYFFGGAAISVVGAVLIFVFSQSRMILESGILLGVVVALNLVFPFLLAAPTRKGQDIRTHIEGLKLYMETAEEMPINAADITGERAPLMTTERYERFLPFAIALGVEKPWTRYFEAVLPEAAKDYRTRGIHGANAGSLSKTTRSVVKSISSGVSRAAPQSSSSSGSGGGGSSGGGGGGGGGGW